MNSELRDKLLFKISNGQLESVLDEAVFKDGSHTLLKARWAILQRKVVAGTISLEDTTLEENKITDSLLRILFESNTRPIADEINSYQLSSKIQPNKCVFISYNEHDATVAYKLALYFKHEGIKVWIDNWNIDIGDSEIKKRNLGLNESQYLLYLVSDHKSSPIVERELFSTLNRQIVQRSITILPVIINNGEMPIIMHDIRPLQLQSVTWDIAKSSLLRAISKYDADESSNPC